MKITVFGATGGIGRHVLTQAVAAGHDVTAAVRDPGRVTSDVRVIALDLARPEHATLESSVRGADVVISALGPRTAADAGIAARGTEEIVEAMWSSGVRRILVVSAAPIGTVASPGRPHPPKHDPGDGLIMRTVLNPMIRRILREHYAVLARMEDVLRDSRLDWTSVRPPRLTDGTRTGAYRTATERNLRRGTSVSRADVADYMLRAIDDTTTFRHAMGVAY